jgi:hypothetical protein
MIMGRRWEWQFVKCPTCHKIHHDLVDGDGFHVNTDGKKTWRGHECDSCHLRRVGPAQHKWFTDWRERNAPKPK